MTNLCQNGTERVCYEENHHQVVESTGYLLYILYQLIGSIILMRMLIALMSAALSRIQVSQHYPNNYKLLQIKAPHMSHEKLKITMLKFPQNQNNRTHRYSKKEYIVIENIWVITILNNQLLQKCYHVYIKDMIQRSLKFYITYQLTRKRKIQNGNFQELDCGWHILNNEVSSPTPWMWYQVHGGYTSHLNGAWTAGKTEKKALP